jgi:hypothetical protein
LPKCLRGQLCTSCQKAGAAEELGGLEGWVVSVLLLLLWLRWLLLVLRLLHVVCHLLVLWRRRRRWLELLLLQRPPWGLIQLDWQVVQVASICPPQRSNSS